MDRSIVLPTDLISSSYVGNDVCNAHKQLYPRNTAAMCTQILSPNACFSYVIVTTLLDDENDTWSLIIHQSLLFFDKPLTYLFN